MEVVGASFGRIEGTGRSSHRFARIAGGIAFATRSPSPSVNPSTRAESRTACLPLIVVEGDDLSDDGSEPYLSDAYRIISPR